jgi:hypothetical protein
LENPVITHAVYLKPLSSFKGDACYACPTNKERNSIHAAIFQKHIQATHPNVTCNEMPPEHTLIIEGNITSSIRSTKRQQIDRQLRNRIITSCGDANVMMGSKHIDPALCIYIDRNCDVLPIVEYSIETDDGQTLN